MTFARKWDESILSLICTACFGPRRQLSRNNMEHWLLERSHSVNFLTPLEVRITRIMLAMQLNDKVMPQLEWRKAL